MNLEEDCKGWKQHLAKRVKGIVNPKILILSLITHRHVVPNQLDLRSFSKHKLRYFWWNPRAFWPCIDSNATTMFKAQKRSKDIVKIVHATSVFNRNFMKLREYFLCAKKTKITLFNNFLYWWRSLRSDVELGCTAVCLQAEECTVLHTHASWYCCERESKTDTEEKKLLNKVIIFVFFVHKTYSCCFINLKLNHWCHMDYFNGVFTTFLGLECGNSVAVYMQGQKALGFHKKYLNLCSEDERRCYGFGTTWGWVINDRIVIFGWTIPLRFEWITWAHYLLLVGLMQLECNTLRLATCVFTLGRFFRLKWTLVHRSYSMLPITVPSRASEVRQTEEFLALFCFAHFISSCELAGKNTTICTSI